MKSLAILVSATSVLAIGQNDNISIAEKLTRQKRDLIGWNRTKNTVNKYARHNNVGKDKKTYAKQYKQILMDMHQRSLQDLGNQLKKAIKMIRKRRKIKNHTR